MAKEIKDENGNIYVQKKPFYKKWWFWLLIVVVVLFLIGVLENKGSSSEQSSEPKTEKATGHKTSSKEKGTTQSNSDTGDINVISKKIYKPNYTDTSWQPATVTINKVGIYKIKPYAFNSDSDKKSGGMIIINASVKANRDIETFPDQGTVITSTGEQHEAILHDIKGITSNWGGDIGNGVTKKGDIIVPIDKISHVSDIKNIRLKFSGNYDTDDLEDENYNHDYDITLNF